MASTSTPRKSAFPPQVDLSRLWNDMEARHQIALAKSCRTCPALTPFLVTCFERDEKDVKKMKRELLQLRNMLSSTHTKYLALRSQQEQSGQGSQGVHQEGTGQGVQVDGGELSLNASASMNAEATPSSSLYEDLSSFLDEEDFFDISVLDDDTDNTTDQIEPAQNNTDNTIVDNSQNNTENTVGDDAMVDVSDVDADDKAKADERHVVIGDD